MDSGEFESAISHLLELIEANPDDFMIHHIIGRCFRLNGQLTEAIESLKKSENLIQDDVASEIQPHVYLELGITYLELGELEQAILSLKKGISKYPDCWELHNTLGVAHEYIKEPKKSLKNYQKAQQLIMDASSAHKIIIENDGSKILIADPMETLLRLKSSVNYCEVLNNIGHVLVKLGHLEQAVKALEEAIEFIPEGLNYPAPKRGLELVKNIKEQMPEKEEVEILITDAEKKFGFKQGYKLLYVPWKTIDIAKIAFISLNPGKPPEDADLRVISDERGNSYEVEEATTMSPLTKQFLKLSKYLNTDPESILTGAFCPFRSERWKDFTSEQKHIGFEIGKKFWYPALKKNGVKIIITLGHGAELLSTLTLPIAKELEATLDKEIVLGNNWCSLRRFKGKNITIIQLPHLSQFRIFDNKNSYIKEIEEIFTGLDTMPLEEIN